MQGMSYKDDLSFLSAWKTCTECKEQHPPTLFKKGSSLCSRCRYKFMGAPARKKKETTGLTREEIQLRGQWTCNVCKLLLPISCFLPNEWTAAGYRQPCRWCYGVAQAAAAGTEKPYKPHIKEWCRDHPKTAGMYGDWRFKRAMKKARLEQDEFSKRERYRDYCRERRRTDLGVSLRSNESKNRARCRKKGLPYEKLDYLGMYQTNSACCLCGEHILPEDLSFEHLVPVSRGGGHTTDNVFPAHLGCNFKKGRMTPAEYFATVQKNSSVA